MELSPSAAVWDGRNNRWVIWCHGGNNPGPRQIGVIYSTDGWRGETFARDAANPTITPGSSGATDDKWVVAPKIQRMPDGSYLGFYGGSKVGGPSTGTVHRVTGLSPNALTKQGEVIAAGGPGSWNENGMYPGDWWRDPEGRIHLFATAPSTDTPPGGTGYFWSDDDGASWTQYGSNPVLLPGASGEYDETTGDGGQIGYDGDVLVFNTGGESFTYPTNPPLRAQYMCITPARVASPVRTGKFYLPSVAGARNYTNQTATSLLAGLVGSMSSIRSSDPM